MNMFRRLGRVALLYAAILGPQVSDASTILFVSEYGNGNVRGFDPVTGAPVSLPASYTPVGGNTSGSDGMVTDSLGRLYVNRGDGTIWQRSTDGNTFSSFATLPGASGTFYSLDLTRNATHLFGSQFASNTIYRTSLADATVTTIAGPGTASRFDGVRIGPDGRLYAVDSSNGNIHAFNFGTTTWSTFLTNPLAGDASQLEFAADQRVFLSRTIGGQARIYSFTLNTPGDYAAGLNPSSASLIGSYGTSGAATGIRIGPDNRLYANAFNAGEVWRSNVGITSMDGSAFITGLSEPGSIYFAPVPEPATTALVLGAAAFAMAWRRSRSRLQQ
jgi:streptogramin lyase